ncbi:MAG: hypothetical protein WCD37_02780 [Chloroflexia bacterium]
MGFWNKLKQGFTQLTGGGGNMQLQVVNPQVKRGENLNVVITLNCTSQLSGKSVNVEVAGQESIKFQVPVPATTSPAATAQGASITQQMQEQTKSTQTYHNSVVVDAGPVNMQQGETKQYNASIPIPETVQPSYVGTAARHEWRVRAYLDISMGADIDEDAEITVL